MTIRHLKVSSVLFIWLLVSLSGRSGAQEQECPKRPREEGSAKSLASDWFDRGTGYVESRDFGSALDAFRCSLSLVAHPATLLNAAKAAELAERPALARDLYQRYLDEYPDAGKVAAARQGLERVEPAMTARKGERDSSPPEGSDPVEEFSRNRTDEDATVSITGADGGANAGEGDLSSSDDIEASAQIRSPPDRADAPSAALSGDSSRPSKRLVIPGIALLSSGSAGLVVGAVFQGLATHAYFKGKGTDNGEVWQEMDRDTEVYQRNAVIGFATGGALAVTGLLLYIAGRRKETGVSRVALETRLGGASLQIRF
jgi:hypothetical protein